MSGLHNRILYLATAVVTAVGALPVSDLASPGRTEHPRTEARVRSPEFSEWARSHRFGPGDTLGGVRDRLDGMNPARLRAFDRSSPSRVGYRDVRAELAELIEGDGPDTGIADPSGEFDRRR